MPVSDEMIKYTPTIKKIIVYPIKSLDGVEVKQAHISGALEHDREFAIVDNEGKFVNGKRTPKVHLIRSCFDIDTNTVTLRAENTSQTFHMYDERCDIEEWMSDFFGFSVKVIENKTTGFPDDTDLPGPTVISTETLREVSSWFRGITLDEMRTRLRMNIEIGGVPAFWEDCLFAEKNKFTSFRAGDVTFEGVNPCQRCVTPTRNPNSAEVYSKFEQIFIKNRKASLKPWVKKERFNHYYRLGVNTRVPKTKKTLHVGDKVEVLGVMEGYN